MAMPKKRALDILTEAQSKRILVLGDIMLDQYLWGSMERISPEAPVPVVEVRSDSLRLGGAANVAYNIRVLGSTPVLVGLVGTDLYGTRCLEMMESEGLSADGVISDAARPTTVKTRIMAHHQQVLRTDMESRQPAARPVEKKILEHLQRLVPDVDAVLVQDYNKGVLTRRIITEVAALAKRWKRILTVDPKFDHFFEYAGATVIKPNQLELEVALGVKIRNEQELCRAGKKAMQRLGCSSMLITRGAQGMTLIEKKGAITHVPARTKKVFDVSGAGDTAISTLTVALSAGASVSEATTMANYAAGLVCGEVGVVPVKREALVRALGSAGTQVP